MSKQKTDSSVAGTSKLLWFCARKVTPSHDAKVIVAYESKLGLDVWLAWYQEGIGWLWSNDVPVRNQESIKLWADLPESDYTGSGIEGFIAEGSASNEDH